MSARAYYNEIDPQAAALLRELIRRDLIASGEVDERSIEDVQPDDLRPFRQCHFFAGIGVWSYALRLAGWPDEREVWTGSCPCQPFSAAGKGGGFDDERHLWPAFYWLIEQRRPAVVFGEQVASADADPWIDLVHADLAAMDYAFACVPFPAAGIGAPHIRERAYWLGHRLSSGLEGHGRDGADSEEPGRQRTFQAGSTAEAGAARGLADRDGERLEGVGLQLCERRPGSSVPEVAGSGEALRLADADERAGRQGSADDGGRDSRSDAQPRSGLGGSGLALAERPGPTHGFWRAADWLLCRDGLWRAVEPGTFPLAHGAPARVGRLRGYGNAIVAEQAAAFITACGVMS